MNLLDKTLVLKLNRNWQVIAEMSVGAAITFLCSESGGEKPGYALDITTATDENGKQILVSAQPVSWEDWIQLEIRESDLYIGVSKSASNPEGRIRCPLVVICAHYDKMPMKKPRLSSGNIYERDKGVCQYTGRKLPRQLLNVDHVVPRDRGGKDSWENMVVCDKDINSRKGNRLNHEVGLKLIRAPKAPPSLPASATIKEARHPVWQPFLIG